MDMESHFQAASRKADVRQLWTGKLELANMFLHCCSIVSF